MTNTKDFLIQNYSDYIISFRDNKDLKPQQKSWQKIAEALIDQDPKYLGLRNPDRLRKSVAQCYNEIKNANNINQSTSETTEGKGYSNNVTETDAFKKYCEKRGLDQSKAKSAKYISHLNKEPNFNIVFDFQEEEEKKKTLLDLEDKIENLVKKHIKPIYTEIPINKKSNNLTVLTITDVHIGMDTNETGFGLYGGKWDADEVEERRKIILSKLKDDTNEEIHIHDLGDLLDGWDGETVRKGHRLPQNMDNSLAFETAVNFKVTLIDELVKMYKTIKVYNITNDNHSGDFSLIANSTIKKIIDLKYNNVEYNIQRKFFDHYKWNNFVFILSHGKDSKTLKFGLKPQLDSKGIEKITEYMKIHNLFNRDYDVTFVKGDSHQMLLDYSTTDDFDYFNFPAFSPSSEWVQSNFKRGRSGFVVMKINGKDKQINPYWFDWKE